MIGLLMTGILGSAFAQIDLSKLITGNATSPEALTSARFGAQQPKMVWIFYHAPSMTDPKTKEKRHIFNGTGALQADGTVWRLGGGSVCTPHLLECLCVNDPRTEDTPAQPHVTHHNEGIHSG